MIKGTFSNEKKALPTPKKLSGEHYYACQVYNLENRVLKNPCQKFVIPTASFSS